MKKTKHYSNEDIKGLLIVSIVYYIAFFSIMCYSNRLEFPVYEPIIITKIVEVAPEEEIKWHTAKMSMYNAGDPAQCSGDPCIGASGDNICDMLRDGYNICAANFLPLGTEINIDRVGKCLILDRMSKRYSNKIDWALPFDGEYGEWKEKALKWGVKSVKYTIEGHYRKDVNGEYFQLIN